MKKLTLIIAVIFMLPFTSQRVFAEKTKDTTFNVVIDSSGTLDSKTSEDNLIYNEGKSFLKEVSHKTGDIASSGYDIVVAQQYVYAIQYSIFGIFFFFLLYWAAKSYKKATIGTFNTITPTIVAVVLSSVCGWIFFSHLSIIIQGFVNPDYAAIKDIVEMFKNQKIK